MLTYDVEGAVTGAMLVERQSPKGWSIRPNLNPQRVKASRNSHRIGQHLWRLNCA
jgi:hypothetical protein